MLSFIVIVIHPCREILICTLLAVYQGQELNHSLVRKGSDVNQILPAKPSQYRLLVAVPLI